MWMNSQTHQPRRPPKFSLNAETAALPREIYAAELLLGSGRLAVSYVPADGGGRAGDYRGAADSTGETSCSAKRHILRSVEALAGSNATRCWGVRLCHWLIWE